MPTSIESYFSVLMLFGFSQAVLSIYLLTKEKNRPFSNNMLALMIFFWGFSCYWFFAYIWKGALFSVTVTTFIGPMLALTLFPPIYLYVKYLFYEFKSFQKWDHIHFLPIYIYLSFTLFLFLDSDFSIEQMRKHKWFSLRRDMSAYIATLQGPLYFWMTHKILKRWHLKLEKDFSEIESRKLEWFRTINICFAIVFIIGGISTILRITLINPFYLYMGYHAIMALSLFYIATMIYKYPLLFSQNFFFQKEAKHTEEVEEMEVEESIVMDLEEKEQKEISQIEKEQLIIKKIEKVMKEKKLYQDPNFNLNDLAGAISESRNAISMALNQNLNKTFYFYINELRIQESSMLLSDPSKAHFSIEGIASQSGFKSMSVFYRFFKEIHGVTPSVYRKNAINS
ncbi:helix-turn-helix transcriptional regulator [Moheibacter stercoris]|uniref:AraC-like DNA-binding protein n=1 Tax=Moheibacter stercoris TaxID=1628251 RepID=A0ABV2LSG1_9FLAO